MKVSVIQPDLKWENKRGNLQGLGRLISPLYNKTDLVILPEMFSTGFTMNAGNLYEGASGETYDWLVSEAQKGSFGICGSYIVRQGEKYFNRFVFVSPEGDHYYYDKKHLFSMGDEDKFYSGGESSLVFPFRGFRISPFICYDLRFPVWSRNKNSYDLAIYVANWPEVRINAWNILLRARAIENQCYVAASNRIGADGVHILYRGHSQIINPKGEILASAEDDQECSATADISIGELIDFRNRFNVMRDSDDFELFNKL